LTRLVGRSVLRLTNDDKR